MINSEHVKPRTAIYYRGYPTRFGVIWLDRETKLIIVDFDDQLYKISVGWVSNKPGFEIELTDAVVYVIETDGNANDPDELHTPRDAAERPVMDYQEWLRLLRTLREELAHAREGN